jgi:hypothetical protein
MDRIIRHLPSGFAAARSRARTQDDIHPQEAPGVVGGRSVGAGAPFSTYTEPGGKPYTPGDCKVQEELVRLRRRHFFAPSNNQPLNPSYATGLTMPRGSSHASHDGRIARPARRGRGRDAAVLRAAWSARRTGADRLRLRRLRQGVGQAPAIYRAGQGRRFYACPAAPQTAAADRPGRPQSRPSADVTKWTRLMAAGTRGNYCLDGVCVRRSAGHDVAKRCHLLSSGTGNPHKACGTRNLRASAGWRRCHCQIAKGREILAKSTKKNWQTVPWRAGRLLPATP